MSTTRKQKLKKLLWVVLVFVFTIYVFMLCFAGSRMRITDNPETKKVVNDVRGARTEQFNDIKKKLNLQTSQKPIFKESEQKPEEKQKDNKPEKINKHSNKSQDNNSEKSKTEDKNGETTNSEDNKSGDGNRDEQIIPAEQDSNGDTNDEVNPTEQSSNRSDDIKKLTVTLHANGGECEKSSIVVSLGGTYEGLPEATKDGYAFDGWFTEESGGERVVESTNVSVSENHSLYAHWKETDSASESYTVTFDPDGGRLKSRELNRTMKKGDIYSSLPLPIKRGHDFLGWFTAADGGENVSEGSSFDGAGDITLYAHWEYNPYKYWSQTLTMIQESMYACQIIDCYIEFDDYVTASSCSLLSDCKAGNAARNRGGNTTVDDEWIEDRNPSIIIKCIGNMSNAASVKNAMEERLPGRRILVIPHSAVNGSDKERLYYTLYLGKKVYPSWYEDVDIDKVSSELGVDGKIYE